MPEGERKAREMLQKEMEKRAKRDVQELKELVRDSPRAVGHIMKQLQEGSFPRVSPKPEAPQDVQKPASENPPETLPKAASGSSADRDPWDGQKGAVGDFTSVGQSSIAEIQNSSERTKALSAAKPKLTNSDSTHPSLSSSTNPQTSGEPMKAIVVRRQGIGRAGPPGFREFLFVIF
jgi:hypothetical protein